MRDDVLIKNDVCSCGYDGDLVELDRLMTLAVNEVVEKTGCCIVSALVALTSMRARLISDCRVPLHTQIEVNSLAHAVAIEYNARVDDREDATPVGARLN